MNIAFFGTPAFTTVFLDTLAAAGYAPTLVVTNPDRPVGRGMHMTAPEPKKWGEVHNITVLQPEKLDDAFFDELSKKNWDLFVVVAYGKIIPEHIITLPKFGTINVHYSLLPKYRGATPVESALLHGDTVTGIVVQQMRFKLDTGPLYVKSEVDIAASDTTLTLREKLNAEAVRLIAPTISSIFNQSILPLEQSLEDVSTCTKLKKEDGLVTITDDPGMLDRKFRAYTPWPGIYFMHQNTHVKITKAHLADGIFIVDEVIPENGKRMSFDAFCKSA